MPIVTGYEDTPAGHDALVLGAQLARLTGMRAVVASVHPHDEGRDPRWRERTESVARERFARACVDAPSGAPAEPEFRWLGPASPHAALADHADEVGAAFLVIGSTGHGLAGRLAPGSTVQRLLPTATCPVAVAPRGHRHFAAARLTTVSVAYDASPEADRAAAVAAGLAHRSGAALRLVAVAETPEQRPAARTAALRGLACAPVEVDALADVVDGPVAATLANLPERTDLLVIGARGHGLVRRVLLGGVVGALVRAAHYPVVVVPG